MKRGAIFLDKDGTLVEDVPYNVDPAQVRLSLGAGIGLRRLHAAGYPLIVVSNQSGVARGYFAEESLVAVETRLRELLADEGVPLSGFYYCPHYPGGTVARYAVTCGCRKPAPGMLAQAIHDHDLDPRACWMVGDILDDMEAGRRAGCRTILLDNGHETEWVLNAWREPHHRALDLAEAANVILAAVESEHGH